MIIIANKYHFDQDIKYKDYSEGSIKLMRKKGVGMKQVFLPKSQIEIYELSNGNFEIHIPEWLYEKEFQTDKNPDGFFEPGDEV